MCDNSRWFYRCCDCLTVSATDQNLEPKWDRTHWAPAATCGACGGPVENMGRVEGPTHSGNGKGWHFNRGTAAEGFDMGHKPGPWIKRPMSDDSGWIVAFQDGPGPRVLLPKGPDDWCQEANASLIEAAPDMLAACRAALAYLEANRPKGNIRDKFSQFVEHEHGAVRPLRAAIAKAEGK